MRRTLGILLAVVAVLVFALASCSNDVAPLGEGTLVINIGGEQVRGVQPAISMNTASFALTVTDSLDDNVIDTTLGANTQSVDYKLPAGSYVVKLDAKNSNGDVIGTGSERVTVVPGGTNTITITVREVSGNGTFTISITANDGYGLKLKVYNLLDEEKYSKNLVYSEGKYTTDGEVALANGFYRFEIIRTDTDAVVKADSLRIVKDMTSGYSAQFTFTTDGGITIVNEVLSIPVISISLNKEVLTAEETLVAHAQISGIDDYEVRWYVDGVAQGSDFGTYADLELPLTGKESGAHEVALYVKNSSVIWAESKSFSIGNGAGRAISLSNLAAGGSIEVNGLDADTELSLSGFSLEDGVYIEVVDDGSRGISRGLVDDVVNLFRRQNGTIIPIPDSNGCAEFVAGALGVVEDAKVIIHKLDKLDTDLKISVDEYPNYSGLVEEYYYINFLLDPRFQGLNLKEIVIAKSGDEGAQGISLLQSGMLNRDIEGVIDFSGKWFTGFALNMHYVISSEFGTNSAMKLNVLNPIHVGSSPVTIDKDFNVIMVDEQSSGEYKVVLSINGSNAEEVIREIAKDHRHFNHLHPRYSNGDNRLPYVFPEFDFDNCTITYHLGAVDEKFIFNLDLDSEYTGFIPGDASVVLLEDQDGIEIHDLDSLDGSIDIIAYRDKPIAWAFKADSEQLLNIERFDNYQATIHMNVIGPGRGGGSGFGKTMEVKGSGFFFLLYEGNEESAKMLTLSYGSKQPINCASVEWNPDTLDYVCADDDCETCETLGQKKHYDGEFIHLNWENISPDTFWTEAEFGDYGRIGYSLRGFVYASNDNFDTSTTGNIRPNDPYGTLAWKHNDTDRKVEIRLKKIFVAENKIVCDIALNGSEEFTRNVVMSPKKNISEIRIEGTPVVQYEQTACNPEGLTVTAYYSDGTTADVTARAEFKTENGSDSWGNIISYSNGHWNVDNSWHRIKAYYQEDGLTWNAKSESFMLHPQKGENTYETAYELPYGVESYIVLDTSGFDGNLADPIIIDGENVSGYLLEGATAGKDAVMIFRYSQYSDNAYVDFNSFYGMMSQYGVPTDDSETLPAFNWYSSNGQTRMMVCSFSGQGDPFELVVVYGRLQNSIDPEVGICKNDFDSSTTKTFYIKRVSN